MSFVLSVIRSLLADRTRAGAVCILICAGYAIAGLSPFDFITGNAVRWLSPGPGVSLSGHALLRSSAPLDLSAAPGITIECYLEPAEEPHHSVAVFLSLYDGRLPQNLLLGQGRKSFLLRTPAMDRRGRRRYREMDGAAALTAGIRRLVAVTSGPYGVILYVDGAPNRFYPEMTLAPDSLRGDVILGTGARGGTDWDGKVFGLAVFRRPMTASELEAHSKLWRENKARALSADPSVAGLYLFDEGSGRTVRDVTGRIALEIPEVYRYPAKEVLLPPWDDSGFPHLHDIALNVAGFVPFGFFFFVYRNLSRPGRRVSAGIQTVAMSASISLLIEVLQVYLPSRSSSLTDVMCNTAGGLIGVLLAEAIGSPHQ